ncbi:MAG TPA: rhodanese-like domain-containing protein [Gammaproteobacteria bacterium]|nr:rhodanese-like domain-containing protein [Gammaproteobacteria bacterium]
MTEIMVFVQHHPLLLGGLVAIIAMIIWTEFQRLTAGFENLSPQEVVSVINHDSPLLLDVREAKEVAGGTIAGAKHIPVGQLSQRINELAGHKNDKIVAFCRSGNRSGNACRVLKRAGYEDVVNMAGGMLAWESANLPVSKK